MKTFKRAQFEGPVGTYTIEPYFKSDYTGLLFHHLVVEQVHNGYCIQRMEVHPWRSKFNLLRTMRKARNLCFGKKVLHVKS